MKNYRLKQLKLRRIKLRRRRRNHTLISSRPSGFSLIELLIVVAVIGVLSAISIPYYAAHRRAAEEQKTIARLSELGSVQGMYKTALGRRRYGTLGELRAATTGEGRLMNERLAPADAAGNPEAVSGWIVREPSAAPTGAALASAFALEAVPAEGNPSPHNYCTHEDGVIRRAIAPAPCGRTSPPVDR